MSRQNKVNKNNYDQNGRLTPDDMARERKKQRQMTGGASGTPSRFGAAGPPSRARSGEAGEENVMGKVQPAGAQEPSRPRTAREEEE